MSSVNQDRTEDRNNTSSQKQNINQSVNQFGSLYSPSTINNQNSQTSSQTSSHISQKPQNKIKPHKKENKTVKIIFEILRIILTVIALVLLFLVAMALQSLLNDTYQKGGSLIDNIPRNLDKSIYIIIIIYIIITILLFTLLVLSFISLASVNDILNKFEYYLNPSFQDDPGFISITNNNLNIYIYDIITTIIIVLFSISFFIILIKKEIINQFINIKYIIGVSGALLVWLIVTSFLIYYCYIKKYIEYKGYIQEPLYYFDSYITSQLITLPSFINDPILTIKYNILTCSLASCIYTVPKRTNKNINTDPADESSNNESNDSNSSENQDTDNANNIVFVQQKNMSDVHQWIIDKIILNFNDYKNYIQNNKNINDNDKNNYINDITNKILISINLFIFFHENIGISLQNSTQNEIYNISNIKDALSIFISENNLVNQLNLLLGINNNDRSISKYIRLKKPHIKDHTKEFTINNKDSCGKLNTLISNIKYSTDQINIINSILDKFDTFDTIKKTWIETYKSIFIGYGIIPYNIIGIAIILFITRNMNIETFDKTKLIPALLVFLLLWNLPCVYLLMTKEDV